MLQEVSDFWTQYWQLIVIGVVGATAGVVLQLMTKAFTKTFVWLWNERRRSPVHRPPISKSEGQSGYETEIVRAQNVAIGPHAQVIVRYQGRPISEFQVTYWAGRPARSLSN
tara:strand:- start:9 stop:344 length:336 start_codon:yes stop_codon:yes gene_type:complete